MKRDWRVRVKKLFVILSPSQEIGSVYVHHAHKIKTCIRKASMGCGTYKYIQPIAVNTIPN